MKAPFVIVALDNLNLRELRGLMGHLSPHLTRVKVGMELFYRYGPKLVAELGTKYNLKVFLDLKLHDIPQTVSHALRSLEDTPIEFLTVHLNGGEQMLREARSSQKKHLPRTQLLGVSYLTSLGPKDFESLWGFNAAETAKRFQVLVDLARECSIPGLVLSALELPLIKKPQLFVKVCPGIRMEEDSKGDQKRVATPKKALAAGANYLVMGRPILEAKDPVKVIKDLSKLTPSLKA